MTSDENVWSGLVGGLPYALVRTGFDQMAFQRFMAAKTIKDATRIVVAGAVSVILFFVIIDLAALALIYWYRDCDPLQAGAISNPDQGAACGSFIVCVLQLWHALGRGLSGFGRSPLIPGTLDRCPESANYTINGSSVIVPVYQSLSVSSANVFPLYRISFFWISFIGLVLTVLLGTLLSIATESQARDFLEQVARRHGNSLLTCLDKHPAAKVVGEDNVDPAALPLPESSESSFSLGVDSSIELSSSLDECDVEMLAPRDVKRALTAGTS
ncbi:hypothetical protein MTO96_028231 [Rhipicephalus appendiculatus]